MLIMQVAHLEEILRNLDDLASELEFLNIVKTLLENDLMFTIAEITVSYRKICTKHGLEDDTSLKWDRIKVKQMISERFEFSNSVKKNASTFVCSKT